MRRVEGLRPEMAATRKPARARPRPRARRHPLAALRLPVLEQRHLDVLGLALVALGTFLAFLLWLGWEGGAAGDFVVDGLRDLVGRVAYAVPPAVLAVGALLVLRPVLPAVRPLRTGGICLALAAVLAFSAGTLGLGPGEGGLVGDALLDAVSSAVGTVGAHILAVFLFVAGVLLLTGATVAGVLRATGTGVADTTRVLRAAAPSLPRREVAPARSATTRAPGRTAPRSPDPTLPAEPMPVQDVEPEGPPEPEPEPEPEDVEPPEPEPVDPPEPDAEPDPEPDRPALALTPDDLTPQGRLRPHVTEDPAFAWRPPPATLLRRSTPEQARPDTAGQGRTGAALVQALANHRIQAELVGTVAGPHITRFELRLASGTKMKAVAALKDDLAYALAATDIRILAPIPGKTAVGVEVPNQRRRIVHLGDVLGPTPEGWSPLTVWLGKDVAGKPIGADLAKMPHLLVAGTTGAGKSGAINAMLASVLLRASPHEVRLVLVDPKQVELNHYESIPHLLTPVITSPRSAANALQNLVREMEQRYSIMSLARTRSLPELNRVRAERGEVALPYVLCVIDELADLMMVAPADVEDSIIRLAQKARAVGIHLVLATQSPRVDVITGMIKANVPSRIAFAVSSQTDSRVILDQNGAESLLGQGDMLFSPVGSSRLQRIQGAYVDEDQVAAITDDWRRQGEPELREDLLEEVEGGGEAPAGAEDDDLFDPDEDPLLEDAIRLVAEMQTASTSMLQRRLRLGYTRAGRLIDMLERRGVISGYEGSKPRQVLVGEGDVERVVAALREKDGAEAGGRVASVGSPSREEGPVPEPP